MKNWKDTILAQYANSPTITKLVESFNESVDPSVDIDAFFRFIWNVDTSNDQGLDFWGKVVDIPRQLEVDPVVEYFGFDEANPGTAPEPSVFGFNNGVFYGNKPRTNTYTLPTEAYRKLILVKAMSNITDSTAASINRALNSIWRSKGRCYVQDIGGMEMRFVFEFDLSPIDISIIMRSNAIARPAGVKLTTVIQVDTANVFGFAEAKMQPFNHGVFFSERNVIYAS